jgi:uncharacterized protein (DUF58 family)
VYRSNHVRARLTREGWYYLSVLSFIVVGAALCHVNLLVVLGGMMLAPLLINWRLALANLRGITVRRLPVRQVSASQPLVVEFEITNPRRWFACWMLVAEDRWKLAGGTHGQLAGRSLTNLLRHWLQRLLSPPPETSASALATCVGPGETVRIHYELLIPRRGRYVTKALRWRSTFPLGLIEASVTFARGTEVLITPRIARLSAEWTHFVSAALAGEGERQLRQRSNEGDFYAVRPWQSGDSTRWMHWRTTARAGRPMVRQFEREASPTVALVLDPYLPAEPTAGDWSRLEAAISFVGTALADLAQRDVGRLAVLIADEAQTLLVGCRSPLFLEESLNLLASVAGQMTDHCDGINRKLDQELGDATLVLVISSRPADSSLGADAQLPSGHILHVASQEFTALYSVE